MTDRTNSDQVANLAVPLSEITSYLDQRLNLAAFPDESLNGVQVEGSPVVSKVGAAVDAGESVIEDAANNKVDLLLVHHGLFWGKAEPIRGALGRKVSLLIRNGISLYAAHLPLDAHPDFGNNAILARVLELKDLRPAIKYRGAQIGLVGTNSANFNLSDMVNCLSALGGYGPGAPGVLSLPFGPEIPQHVAVLTGSGCTAIAEAAAEGFDTLITGEPKQSAYHQCREAKINLICAGHYATETVGVRRLANILADHFKIGQIFLDCPTGI